MPAQQTGLGWPPVRFSGRVHSAGSCVDRRTGQGERAPWRGGEGTRAGCCVRRLPAPTYADTTRLATATTASVD
eukprot:scaffold270_cov390-Prasinococcus_capsulatus_cf.AAC.13